MAPATLHNDNNTNPVALMAIELSLATWKLGFFFGGRERYVTVNAGDVDATVTQLAVAREKLRVPESASVTSCYEAGRDGFWIHRALVARGITNLVVDSASIKVDRRKKRAKSDGVDVKELLTRLRSHVSRMDKMKVCRIPSEQEEDVRQLRRHEEALKDDRRRCSNRITSLLYTLGIHAKVTKGFDKLLDKLVTPLGKPIPENLKLRLKADYELYLLLRKQLDGVLARQRELMEDKTSVAGQKATKMTRLRGIAQTSGWAFSAELFAWRKFTNGKQVGGLMGLTPTPYSSGEMHREQGISKAGHSELRGLAVEIAWGWVRYQPHSELTLWFHRKFGGSGRSKKVGIVALARKLMVALWRYVEFDVVPTGAMLKAA